MQTVLQSNVNANDSTFNGQTTTSIRGQKTNATMSNATVTVHCAPVDF
jgi:hypothetical protein